jgi:hypothetical protein
MPAREEDNNTTDGLLDRWKKDTTNPMSAAFISPIERFVDGWGDTAHYLIALCSSAFGVGGKTINTASERAEFVQPYTEYRAELESINSDWRVLRDVHIIYP